jgi:hypothetical protein
MAVTHKTDVAQKMQPSGPYYEVVYNSVVVPTRAPFWSVQEAIHWKVLNETEMPYAKTRKADRR